MSNFGRVLRLALRYRANLAGIVICSLGVALLWGANIGVAYPFMQLVVYGKSAHDWVDEKIAEGEGKDGELRDKIARLEGETPATPQAKAALEHDRQLQQIRLSTEAKSLQFFRSLQPAIHRYLPPSPFRTLVIVVILLLVSTAIKDLILMGDMLLVERMVQLTMLDLRKLCFRTTLKMDVSEFGEKGTATLLSRFTNDTNYLGAGLSQLFGNAIREPLKMIVCLILAAVISWRLLLFSLILAPLSFLLLRQLTRSIKRASRRAMEEMSQLYRVLTEAFNGIQTVKAFTMERHERNRFSSSAREYYAKSMRIAFYNALTKPLTELLGVSVIALALVSGAYLVLSKETHIFGIRMCDRPLDPSLLLVFYGLLAGMSDPARKLADIYSALQGAVAASDRVFALLDAQPKVTDPASPLPLPHPFRHLVFDNVAFHYTPDHPVLRGVNLKIKFGETLAIVGPNGCGKTTLANLVPRFFDPQDGAVRLDDTNIRDVRLRDIRGQIGLVTQHAQLFDDTVLNNIRYGSPQATDDEVMEAAKKAHAHQFILDKLEHGYQTRVGQGGGKLSGGQRQRLSLARAILRDPAILLLDEATSQVDLESEQLIHKVLEEFIRGRTTIIITHRLSTLALANRILVMDAGQVADVGTHLELLQRCELYRRLYNMQFQQSA